MKKLVRVRFSPSPTGIMHLGNIRVALMNYLFAKQHDGTFILRIEDTDPERNFDPGAKIIIKDLLWAGLDHDEGPSHGGPHAPYFQSERTELYQEQLSKLIDKKLVYRCFCTTDELDKKRQRQMALKMPPRYDRTCLKLSDEAVQKNLDAAKPFIWRFKLDHDARCTIQDIAHGTINFEMKNFSDFPLSRQNGTFTFMFANFVDDMLMEMSHVLRGEDHLSNTAGQAALYQAFDKKIPVFWHLPIICNAEGKKLSKRDFGFSINDLQKAGFLPEAVCNYLAVIGGGTFKDEIMSLETLAQSINFEHQHSTGHVRYDVEKLKWINHHWIDKLDPKDLTQRCLPLLIHRYPQAEKLSFEKLTSLIQVIKTDINTLSELPAALRFYFETPDMSIVDPADHIPAENLAIINDIVTHALEKIDNVDEFIKKIKEQAKKNTIPLKHLFRFLRLCFMGAINGPSIHDLIAMLGNEEAKQRLKRVLVEE